MHDATPVSESDFWEAGGKKWRYVHTYYIHAVRYTLPGVRGPAERKMVLGVCNYPSRLKEIKAPTGKKKACVLLGGGNQWFAKGGKDQNDGTEERKGRKRKKAENNKGLRVKKKRERRKD